jgi:hypothetical protein
MILAYCKTHALHEIALILTRCNRHGSECIYTIDIDKGSGHFTHPATTAKQSLVGRATLSGRATKAGAGEPPQPGVLHECSVRAGYGRYAAMSNVHRGKVMIKNVCDRGECKGGRCRYRHVARSSRSKVTGTGAEKHLGQPAERHLRNGPMGVA